MQSSETLLFTLAEAAALTDLSVKTVNNAIDKRTIAAVAARREGGVTRLLDLRALVSLKLERRYAARFVPEFRRMVFDALATAPRTTLSIEGGLQIDLRAPRRELAVSLRQLRRARQLVIRDSEIMGSDPVFKGTRVPVHAVAAQLADGDSVATILDGYPGLTDEMVTLAPLYAAAYPLRGRPRVQPWHGQKPVSVTRRKLATSEVG